MLILKRAGLVFLSNPKTAGQSIRKMLAALRDETDFWRHERHRPAESYHRMFGQQIAEELGRVPETVAVMREPRAHMESWYRYRLREAAEGRPTSTRGITFPEFVEARLTVPTPAYARIGRQDRFLGLKDGIVQVTHVFDYARLDLLVDFLSERLGLTLALPRVNISPVLERADLTLPETLEARYRAAFATEFALYDQVAKAGVLVTR